MWSIGSPIGKIGIEDDFAPHLDLFKHILEIAHMVKADCIRLFSFLFRKGKSPDDYKGEVIERLSEFCEAAKGAGCALPRERKRYLRRHRRPLP